VLASFHSIKYKLVPQCA